MFISIACKIAVPVFFMITGALLLGKEESIKEIYRKRILKFVVILLVMSIIYQMYDWKFRGAEFSWVNCFKRIYSSNASVALWYLYSYIGVLMMLPFLRKLVQLMNEFDYFYLIMGYVCITGVIPITQYYFSAGTVSLTGSFSAALFTTSNIFFVLLGYFLERVLKQKYFNKKNMLILIGASVLSIVLCCMMTQYKANLTGELSEGASQSFHNSLIVIPTFTMYYGMKLFCMKVKIPQRVQKGIIFIGSTTFGIYLLERILRERLAFVFTSLKPLIRTMPATLVYISVCLMVGCIVVAMVKRILSIRVYKRIPIIREYI
jgi:surface polysaccharide O-acyltransferase-like enzyme